MIVFITGGCKNGKTHFALECAIKLAQNNDKYYLATMIPFDEEDEKRIKNHQEERENLGFKTLEIGTNIGNIHLANRGTVLLDSITSLLLNETFLLEKLENNNMGYDVAKKVCNDIDKLISTCDNLVIVSDFIYSDGIIYNEYTDTFMHNLASIDKHIAKISDVLIERISGVSHFIKGSFEL